MTATQAQVDAAGKAMFYGSLGSGSTVLWDGMREETKAFWRDRGRYIADAVAAVVAHGGPCPEACRLIHEHRHCPGDCGCVTYPNATDERWPDAARSGRPERRFSGGAA